MLLLLMFLLADNDRATIKLVLVHREADGGGMRDTRVRLATEVRCDGSGTLGGIPTEGRRPFILSEPAIAWFLFPNPAAGFSFLKSASCSGYNGCCVCLLDKPGT